MEDLIIYGAGALAIRGARRMFFGPSRETRLAQQVCVSPADFLGVSWLLHQQAVRLGDGNELSPGDHLKLPILMI